MFTCIFVGSAKEARIIDRSYDDAVQKAAAEPVDPKTAPLNPRVPGPGSAGGQNAGGEVPPGSGGGPAAATPTSVVTADKTVLERPIVQLNSAEELAARAAAEARAGRLEASAVLYDDVARADPSSRHLADYAGVLGLLGNKDAASSLVSRMETAAPSQVDTARRKMLVGLLRSGLYNNRYEDAIAAGEELVARPDEASDAWARLWLACAYGQRHAQVKSVSADDPRLGEAADKVVTLLGQAIGLDPSLKPLARSLYTPGQQSGDDDDLQSLYQNPWIDEILKD